ncbi:YALIA101S04e02014g1_1 [Yarrowia lipolytica]|nr:Putative transporter [Yarrowia lipolytica]SEI33772.1 YALIA101S04e02014g1_1 [Yarrowia lipolytica]
MVMFKRPKKTVETVETLPTGADTDNARLPDKNGLETHNEKCRPEGTTNDTNDTNEMMPDREKNGARPPIFSSTWKEIICIFLLALSPVLEALTTGALLVALDKIGQSYKIEGGQLSWTLSAFSLGTGSSLLIMAGLADSFGRKKTLIAGYTVFAATSLISGFMKNDVAFDVLRAIQGVATGAAIPASVGILGSIYRKPSKRKNRAMAGFAAGAPLGFVVGLVVGGICGEFIGWQGILFFFAIMYFLAALACVWYVPPDPPMSKPEVIEKLKNLDYGGAALCLAGFTLFVFAMTHADSTEKGWKTPYIIGLFVTGFVLIVLFVLYECYIASNPIMPPHIWKCKGFAVCMACVALGMSTFLGTTQFYITMYFQNIKGTNPILTTAYFVPMVVAGICVNVFAAMTLHLIPGRFLMMLAQAGFFGAALLMALVGVHTSYWAIPFPAEILSVIGADLLYNVSTLLTINSVSEDLQSRAAGIFNTIAMLSAAVALAAASSIASAKVSADETHKVSKETLLDSYHAAFWFSVGTSAAGLVLSFFLNLGTSGGDEGKDVDQDTEEVETDSITGVNNN